MSEHSLDQRLDSLPRLTLLWFGLLAPPIAWAAHLTVEYFLVTLHCQLQGGSTDVYMTLTSAASLLLCVAGGVAAWLAWRRLSYEEHHGWAQFMAASGIFLSVLFLIGIVLGTVPVYALETCNEIH
jgi:hypothetical protein